MSLSNVGITSLCAARCMDSLTPGEAARQGVRENVVKRVKGVSCGKGRVVSLGEHNGLNAVML